MIKSVNRASPNEGLIKMLPYFGGRFIISVNEAIAGT
jgi:hypothetical protein